MPWRDIERSVINGNIRSGIHIAEIIHDLMYVPSVVFVGMLGGRGQSCQSHLCEALQRGSNEPLKGSLTMMSVTVCPHLPDM